MQAENQILICAKHKKHEKNMAVIPNNYYICLNRYCPDSCTIICSQCKQDHRDHIVKILSIEDICFLVDRLLKTPFKQATNYMIQTIDVMQKLQLIRQFKKKIDRLEQQIQKQTVNLVDMTETLISEYAKCKKAANQTADLLFDIENIKTAKSVVNTRIDALSRIDYNFQKDKFEYGGLQVKQKQDMRRKINMALKRKIQQVKQYSMKIIEVILNSEESQEQQEDLILKKKIYENLKAQLFALQKQSKQKQDYTFSTRGNTAQLSQCSAKQLAVKATQTQPQKINHETKIKNLENSLKQSTLKIQKLQKLQKQHQQNLKMHKKQNQTLNKQIKQNEKKLKQYQLKIQLLTHFQEKLRDNYIKRIQREHQRQRIIHVIADLVQNQNNSKSGRRSVSKDPKQNTRQKSKSPKKNNNLANLKEKK